MSVAIVPTIRVAEATRVLEEIYTKEDPMRSFQNTDFVLE